MSKLLPLSVNPWLLLKQQSEISGKLDLATMQNLCASQNREIGDVHVTFSITRRGDGEVIFAGNASVDLEFVCQRCLLSYEDNFKADFELVVVKYETQIDKVSELDDVIVAEEKIDVLPLIEQELILALPMIAKHDDCSRGYETNANVESETQRPFANLKDILG